MAALIEDFRNHSKATAADNGTPNHNWLHSGLRQHGFWTIPLKAAVICVAAAPCTAFYVFNFCTAFKFHETLN